MALVRSFVARSRKRPPVTTSSRQTLLNSNCRTSSSSFEIEFMRRERKIAIVARLLNYNDDDDGGDENRNLVDFNRKAKIDVCASRLRSFRIKFFFFSACADGVTNITTTMSRWVMGTMCMRP